MYEKGSFFRSGSMLTRATEGFEADYLMMGAKDKGEMDALKKLKDNDEIKELLPNVRVANDARELILNCCTEFIQLVSSEANDICNKQAKKTISPEHALQGKSLYDSANLLVTVCFFALLRLVNYGTMSSDHV